MRKGRKFLINACILSISSFFMRTIGVSFNVYISNKLGASGVGLFQLIMSVYMFAVTVATSGITLAATRLVTEELAAGSSGRAGSAVRCCMRYALFFGTASAVGLFFYAEPIGVHFLGDERTVRSLRLLSVSLPFIAMSAVLNGYFTAVRRVVKSASAQIFEQFVKIGVCVIGLNFLMPDGIEYACMAVVGGGCVAESASFFFQWILYALDRKRCGRKERNSSGKKHLTGEMLSIALPVAVSAYARSALTTIEHVLIPPRLRAYGYGKDEALARYGVVHGMVLPVLFFPSAVLAAFSSLLVPEMAEYHVHGSRKQIHYVISQVLHAALIFAIGVSGVFFAFSQELGLAVYQSREAGMYLRIFSPLVIVMYLDSVVDGMLKGLNQQVSSMRYNVIDSLVSVLMVHFLIPVWGIAGYVAVIYVSETLNGFLSLNRLIRVTDYRVDYKNWIFKPLAAVFAAAFSVRVICHLIFGEISAAPQHTALLIGCTALLYLLLLAASSCISRDDMEQVRLLFRTN